MAAKRAVRSRGRARERLIDTAYDLFAARGVRRVETILAKSGCAKASLYGPAEPERFAQAWHMLMKGSIVSACDGNRYAAREAKQAARLVLAGWPRAGAARRRIV